MMASDTHRFSWHIVKINAHTDVRFGLFAIRHTELS